MVGAMGLALTQNGLFDNVRSLRADFEHTTACAAPGMGLFLCGSSYPSLFSRAQTSLARSRSPRALNFEAIVCSRNAVLESLIGAIGGFDLDAIRACGWISSGDGGRDSNHIVPPAWNPAHQPIGIEKTSSLWQKPIESGTLLFNQSLAVF